MDLQGQNLVYRFHGEILRVKGTFQATGLTTGWTGLRKAFHSVSVPPQHTYTHPRGNRVPPGHSVVRLLSTPSVRCHNSSHLPSTHRNTRLVCGYVFRSVNAYASYSQFLFSFFFVWFFRLPFFLRSSVYVNNSWTVTWRSRQRASYD